MMNHRFGKLQQAFDADHAHYWSNLSRINNLLVIMNISMFFLTGLVARGYFYTCYSLVCLGAVGMGVLVPTTLTRHLWYYWTFLLVELSGLYFWVASVVYWIGQGSA